MTSSRVLHLRTFIAAGAFFAATSVGAGELQMPTKPGDPPNIPMGVQAKEAMERNQRNESKVNLPSSSEQPSRPMTPPPTPKTK